MTRGDNASNTAVATRALWAVKRLPFVTIESITLMDHFADKIDSASATFAMRQVTVGAALAAPAWAGGWRCRQFNCDSSPARRILHSPRPEFGASYRC